MATLEDLKQRAARLSASLSTDECCTELSEYVPTSFDLGQLNRLVQKISLKENPRSTILAIAACLQHKDRLHASEDDTTTACSLAARITQSITPINASSSSKDEGRGFLSGYGGATDSDPYPQITARVLSTSEAGLTALTNLTSLHHPTATSLLDTDSLITLISLSSPDEAWSTPTTAALASHLLDSHLKTQHKAAFIVESVLKHYLHPLFSRSRPSTVTSSGRKAEFLDDELDKRQGLPDDSSLTKPWKYTDLRSLPVFAWAISQFDGTATTPWPLYTPILLTLLDDSLTRVRSRGLSLAATFLTSFPAGTLRQTGLASVFEDAIFPTLGYLPSLTPEDEALLLLPPAYDALLVLAAKLSSQPEAGQGDRCKAQERKLLDKIVRGGILTGYFHCPEHPRIVELLMGKTGVVVGRLGVGSVKHLKDLVPMLKGVLTDPFAFAHPGTVLAGLKAMQTVVENCWPRLREGVWADEMFGCVVVCWVHLLDVGEEEEQAKRTEEMEEIRCELRKTAAMLAAVAKSGGGDLGDKVTVLVKKEPGLAVLFNS